MRGKAGYQYKEDNPDDDPGRIAAAVTSSLPATEPSYKKEDWKAQMTDRNKRDCFAHFADGYKIKIVFNFKNS